MAGEFAPILTTLYSFYNVVFQPLLALGPYPALATFSLALAGIFSLIYARMLDQERAEQIKEKLNDRQDKMKEARKNGEDEKASEHMQKTMELNQRLMKLNMKPMIGTMVFVALIFPWLGATFSPPIQLEQAGDSTYEGQFEYAGQTQMVTVTNSSNVTVEVGNQTTSLDGEFSAFGVDWQMVGFYEDGGGFFAEPRGTVLRVNAAFIDLPFSLPYIGGALNWLGFYIVIAMPLTFIFRKLLGVA